MLAIKMLIYVDARSHFAEVLLREAKYAGLHGCMLPS